MKESEYIDEIMKRWPSDGDCVFPCDLLALSKAAIESYPLSARLLQLRGNILEIAPSEEVAMDDPEMCYRRAIEIDPLNPDIWNDLAYYLDAIPNNYALAAQAFKRAIGLGGGCDSVYGLCRLYAQAQGKQSLNKIKEYLMDGANVDCADRLKKLVQEIEDGFYD